MQEAEVLSEQLKSLKLRNEKLENISSDLKGISKSPSENSVFTPMEKTVSTVFTSSIKSEQQATSPSKPVRIVEYSSSSSQDFKNPSSLSSSNSLPLPASVKSLPPLARLTSLLSKDTSKESLTSKLIPQRLIKPIVNNPEVKTDFVRDSKDFSETKEKLSEDSAPGNSLFEYFLVIGSPDSSVPLSTTTSTKDQNFVDSFFQSEIDTAVPINTWVETPRVLFNYRSKYSKSNIELEPIADMVFPHGVQASKLSVSHSASNFHSTLFSSSSFHRGPHIQTVLIRKPIKMEKTDVSSEYYFGVALTFLDVGTRTDSNCYKNKNRSSSIVEVLVPISLVFISSFPCFNSMINVLWAMLGCRKISLLAQGSGMTAAVKFNENYMDTVDENGEKLSKSKVDSDFRASTSTLNHLCDLWFTLAVLVDEHSVKVRGPLSYTLTIPSRIKSHVSEVLLQRVPFSNAEIESSYSDWCYCVCLHSLMTSSTLLDLLLALLLEHRIVIIDSNPFLMSAAVCFCLNLLSPLHWTGPVLTSVSSSMTELLAAPVPFIVALGLPTSVSSDSIANEPSTILRSCGKSNQLLVHAFEHLDWKQDFIESLFSPRSEFTAPPAPSHTIVWIPSEQKLYIPENLHETRLLRVEKLYQFLVDFVF